MQLVDRREIAMTVTPLTFRREITAVSIDRPTAIRLFVLAALLSAAVYAQLSTSSITGTVRDSSGSVIPGASVSLRNVNTAVERQSVTNDSGNYVFLNIQPGRYTLEAVRPGFSKSVIAPFTLEVNQTATF